MFCKIPLTESICRHIVSIVCNVETSPPPATNTIAIIYFIAVFIYLFLHICSLKPSLLVYMQLLWLLIISKDSAVKMLIYFTFVVHFFIIFFYLQLQERSKTSRVSWQGDSLCECENADRTPNPVMKASACLWTPSTKALMWALVPVQPCTPSLIILRPAWAAEITPAVGRHSWQGTKKGNGRKR